MGKKLDALLGRSFKSTKLRALVNLAFSRIAVLSNQRHARSSHARSDVLQLLQLGHHDRALLRVEQVIKEQNLLDAYAIIDSYCNVVLERIKLLEQERECPEELKEAISGLLFASSRCGDFPELQEIRAVFTTRFGREFTARAIELRNNCAVNPVMIQKLSARPPSMEIKLKLLKQIASENGIVLKNLEMFGVPTEMQEQVEAIEKQNEPEAEQKTKVEDDFHILPDEIVKDNRFSESMKGRKKYKDVADAAQAAFESAAYAAAAARAAVELSQSKSFDPDDQGNQEIPSISSSKTYEANNTKTESESYKKESHIGSVSIEVEESENAAELKNSKSSSSSESGEIILEGNENLTEAMNITNLLEKDLVFDESDIDVGNEESKSPTVEERDSSIQSHLKMKSEFAEVRTHVELEGSDVNNNGVPNISMGNGAVSVRTREVRGEA